MYNVVSLAGPTATVIAAVAAVVVTWRLGKAQLRIAENQAATARQQVELATIRLQHDLFDRRFAVYDATRTIIRTVIQHSHANEQQIVDFAMKTRDAKFLLDDEISTYLEDFANKAWDILTLESELGATNDLNKKEENTRRQRALKDWIRDQHQTLADKFIPYLKLKS